MPLIEFMTLEHQLALFPHPYPAGRSVPAWLKGMPMDNEGIRSLKRCPPFLEAMVAGYLIPAPCDVEFTVTADGQVSWQSHYKVIESHTPPQYAGAPFQNNVVLKFKNPWVIRTPAEYCTLITGPVNRFNLPFVPLSGIVETATYYREVHLPMVSTMRPGGRFLLKRGEPLAQVIPIRHEQWTSQAAALDVKRRDEVETAFQHDPHRYRETEWRKLQYD
jgi:hypothetical protein